MSESLQRLLDAQRQAFATEPYPSLKVRLDRLQRLRQMLDRNEGEIVAAINADFGGRSPYETRLTELFVLRQSLLHARKHLWQWMRMRRVPTVIYLRPGSSRLLSQPLGVVGVISPWNFPLLLSLGPALAALAAGNRVLIKPSEHTPQFSALLQRIVGASFAPEEMCVITGDEDVGKALSGSRLDHLFFTGSTAVGRRVAQEAARNLTPVTLELGGKSPAILDASCDMETAIMSIAFAKFLNAGQTCIAPDYLMVPRGMAGHAVELLASAVARLYPSLGDNADFSAIINDQHHARLQGLLGEARTAGARVIELNPAQEQLAAAGRKFLPTLVLDAPAHARLMSEEIFGPVLPIIEYDSPGEAIAHVNSGEKPLAMYWFGSDQTVRERMLREVIVGGVTINDCLVHFLQEYLPFGGVGASGTGAYHGEWGFRTFSQEKPVFYQSRFNGAALFHPPFGKRLDWLLKLLDKLRAAGIRS